MPCENVMLSNILLITIFVISKHKKCVLIESVMSNSYIAIMMQQEHCVTEHSTSFCCCLCLNDLHLELIFVRTVTDILNIGENLVMLVTPLS